LFRRSFKRPRRKKFNTLKNIKKVKEDARNIKNDCKNEIDEIIDIVGYDCEEFKTQENINHLPILSSA